MKKLSFIILICVNCLLTYSQSAKEIVNSKDTEILWLGIDYSQVKLYGSFAELTSPGGYNTDPKDAVEIRDRYFY